MIWSSAQPYNVRDMIEKCFGEEEVIGEEEVKEEEVKPKEVIENISTESNSMDKDLTQWMLGEINEIVGNDRRKHSITPPKRVLKTRRLKAVWARDTLGLSKSEYCK
jgi:hypothetical protein